MVKIIEEYFEVYDNDDVLTPELLEFLKYNGLGTGDTLETNDNIIIV